MTAEEVALVSSWADPASHLTARQYRGCLAAGVLGLGALPDQRIGAEVMKRTAVARHKDLLGILVAAGMGSAQVVHTDVSSEVS